MVFLFYQAEFCFRFPFSATLQVGILQYICTNAACSEWQPISKYSYLEHQVMLVKHKVKQKLVPKTMK